MGGQKNSKVKYFSFVWQKWYMTLRWTKKIWSEFFSDHPLDPKLIQNMLYYEKISIITLDDGIFLFFLFFKNTCRSTVKAFHYLKKSNVYRQEHSIIVGTFITWKLIICRWTIPEHLHWTYIYISKSSQSELGLDTCFCAQNNFNSISYSILIALFYLKIKDGNLTSFFF
jgi:hypothetical protein